VPTFADSGCHVVSVTNPYGCILDFLDRIRNWATDIKMERGEIVADSVDYIHVAHCRSRDALS
jgi:hypothetical protein